MPTKIFIHSHSKQETIFIVTKRIQSRNICHYSKKNTVGDFRQRISLLQTNSQYKYNHSALKQEREKKNSTIQLVTTKINRCWGRRIFFLSLSSGLRIKLIWDWLTRENQIIGWLYTWEIQGKGVNWQNGQNLHLEYHLQLKTKDARGSGLQLQSREKDNSHGERKANVW